ncbi:hypothetical protein SAMN02745975_03533 [Geosporobacter subterraneus DSM 17957]|uniref:Uncharacterized protein n=1 Tax=Geosporobacter subterraneus DSM 17957 TaxID=1121919 RepID=A0A1M6PB25_9FIRM|nr:hypothetical protein [Geosporobacter subterraneus]SHK05171.1 hypothetical protein SAMN02745975_03533 [Geosporobacter subterraneus DSM 17957]
MFKVKFRTAAMLSRMILILAGIASAGGMLIGDLYRDNELVKAAWYGNDLVTLFVAVPSMAGALWFAFRGSQRAQLIWIGTLWYMVYNYIFYLYAAAFNKFFLLYTALFALSSYAMIFALLKIDAKSMAKKFSSRTPVKWISGYMLFFALLLGGLWIMMSINFIITGQVPQDILQTDHPTGVVYATDLALLMPATVLSAILLWKRQAWGYVLSVMVLVKGAAYSLVLMVMSVISYRKVGQADPYIYLWIALGVGAMLALGGLLVNMQSDN